jgi:hypothetical protein
MSTHAHDAPVEEGQCRVCLDTSADRLPCRCKTGYAHPACIQAWVRVRSLPTCEVCTAPYEGSVAGCMAGSYEKPWRHMTLCAFITGLLTGLLQLAVISLQELDGVRSGFRVIGIHEPGGIFAVVYGFIVACAMAFFTIFPRP